MLGACDIISVREQALHTRPKIYKHILRMIHEFAQDAFGICFIFLAQDAFGICFFLYLHRLHLGSVLFLFEQDAFGIWFDLFFYVFAQDAFGICVSSSLTLGTRA